MGAYVKFWEYLFVEPNAIPEGAERVRSLATLAAVRESHRTQGITANLTGEAAEQAFSSLVGSGLATFEEFQAWQARVRTILAEQGETATRSLLVRRAKSYWANETSAVTDEDRAEELRLAALAST